jgi:hypothetical protein
VIGGMGSTASAVSVLSADASGVEWLQYFTIGMGAVGAVLSVGLIILKFVQQRREMAAWREQYRVFTSEALDDRQELHDKQDSISSRVDLLEQRCTVCGRRMEEGENHG